MLKNKFIFFLLIFLTVWFWLPLRSVDAAQSVMRVNLGGASTFTDNNGLTWQADRLYIPTQWGFYDASSASSNYNEPDKNIANTENDELFQSARLGAFAYVFDNLEKNTNYYVVLYFANIGPNSKPNERVFDVNIEGQLVANDLTLSDLGPSYTATAAVYKDIAFVGEHFTIILETGYFGQPLLSAIEVGVMSNFPPTMPLGTDNNPVIITEVKTTAIGDTQATLVWNTNVPATSQAYYGETTTYASVSPLNQTLDTAHSVTLIGLKKGTFYHYKVASRDEHNNSSVSGDYNFKTTGIAASSCGNNVCEADENDNNCPQDCEPECGNNACEAGENYSNCSEDCGINCGNNICDSNEGNVNCPDDCQNNNVCGNNICEAGETNANCQQDCPTTGQGKITGLITAGAFGGPVIPDVKLLLNPGNKSLNANNAGIYTYENLNPGQYNLTASKNGFNSYTRSNINVSANQTARIDLYLNYSPENKFHPGALIKAPNYTAVYYVGSDMKRYVFPNEKTYFTWYKDFSQVVTIPADELAKANLGGNVTYRPGTRLIKIISDPTVYAVEPKGVLRKITSEETARQLFGPDWAKKIDDLADSFFTNYKVSAQNMTPLAHPVGSLLKKSDSNIVYYLNKDSKLRRVSTDFAFQINRFRWEYVLNNTLNYNDSGSIIEGAEEELIKTAGP